MHIAINDGCSYAVYYVDANGGFATDYGIPTLRAAERIACVRDVQEARHPSRPSHRCVRRELDTIPPPLRFQRHSQTRIWRHPMISDHVDRGNGDARRFLRNAVRSVDEAFGNGSAAQMPELVAALVHSATASAKLRADEGRS
jgi:hypothetical protein